MKKQIITLGLAVLVAGSSAYAFGGPRGGQDCGDNSFKGHKKGMILNSNIKSNSMHSLMSAISDLNLSSSQRSDIRKIMFDLREQNIQQMEDGVAFKITLDGNGRFNKEDFISSRTKLSKKMVEMQANMIEKILNSLNNEQKEIVKNRLSKKVN